MRHVIYTVIFIVAFEFNILQGLCVGDNMNGASINSHKYHAQVTQTSDSGKCEQKVVVKGRGIDDEFSGICFKDQVSFIATEEVLVVGDPTRDSYVLYSNKPANIKLINKEECNRLVYLLNRRTRQIYAEEYVMTNKECDKAREEIAAQLKSNKALQRLRLKPEQSHTKPNINDVWKSDVSDLKHWSSKLDRFAIRANKPSKKDGTCKRSIVIQGLGISDKFVGPCDNHNGPSVYIYKNFPIAIVKNDLLTLLADERQILYAILDGETCEKKVYTRRMSSVKSKSEPVTPQKCDQVKKQVEEYIEQAMDDKEDWEITNPRS